MKTNIDLHIHSHHSDGSFSTQQLINMLADRGIRIFSFTDHDTMNCYEDLSSDLAQLNSGMICIPGVELSCLYNEEIKDILGYGVDYKYIQSFFNKRYSKQHRIDKQNCFIAQMKDSARKHGIIFDESVEAVLGQRSEGFCLMTDEFRKHPVNVERFPFIADSLDFYWNHINNPQSPFFVAEKEDTLTFEEAINLIHAAGGVSMIAHPYHYNMSYNDRIRMMMELVELGVDGVEIKHSSHFEKHITELRNFAHEHHLLMSGGSDFHGAMKPQINLGVGPGHVCVEIADIIDLMNTLGITIGT